jgi:hypothetical protein
MAYNEVVWDFPQYSGYSVLNAAVHPAICWNTLQNNPFISSFEVDYLDTLDNQWIRIGTTASNFIRFPSDVYTTNGSYRIRIATIGTNGRKSPYAYSTVVLASPLVFDFSASQTVRYSNGTTVPNQRYLFLIL